MVQLKRKKNEKKKGVVVELSVDLDLGRFFLVSFHSAADWVLSMYSVGSRHGYKG